MTMMEKMEGGHHDPSTCRMYMGMQGYRDQGCRGAGIRDARIRGLHLGYRDQGCKQLTHCLSGTRKERNYGKHLASPRGPTPTPQGQLCGCRSYMDRHCVEHRGNGVTPPKKIHKYGDLNSITFTNQEH